MAAGIMTAPVRRQRIHTMGDFRLIRFMSDIHPRGENHIGEAILRGDGQIEYMKSFRLSTAQAKRAHLLNTLARHSWNLQSASAALGSTHDELVRRLEKAGFGYLLKDHVLAAARRGRR